MVGKKGLFELKKCTVSGFKRQPDKWHLFRAPTGGGGGGRPALKSPKPHLSGHSRPLKKIERSKPALKRRNRHLTEGLGELCLSMVPNHVHVALRN